MVKQLSLVLRNCTNDLNTDGRYVVQTAYPLGTSDFLTDCLGYMRYRAEPTQVEAGVVQGDILLSTMNFMRVCVGWKVFI